jgi:hypothetical protein
MWPIGLATCTSLKLGPGPKKRVDLKELMEEVGLSVVERFTTEIKVETIRLKPREPVEG